MGMLAVDALRSVLIRRATAERRRLKGMMWR